MTKMLAFRAEWLDSDWATLVHGKTSGEAKMRFKNMGLDDGDFIDVRVRRIPELDDKPFTYANVPGNFIPLDDDGETIPEKDYRNECNCPLCTGEEVHP